MPSQIQATCPIETLRNNREFVTGYREMPSFSSFFIAFNINQGPLVNEKLRRKLTQLIDINNLLRKHIGRRAIKAHELIPPGLLGYEKIFHQPLVENKTKLSIESIELICTIALSFLQGVAKTPMN